MSDIDITQAEADKLIEMEKRFVGEEDWTFPAPGQRLAVALTSLDKRENFMLDITLGGPLHRNPDGEEIPCPHLHMYKEGFGDKWAIAAPQIAMETRRICF